MLLKFPGFYAERFLGSFCSLWQRIDRPGYGTGYALEGLVIRRMDYGFHFGPGTPAGATGWIRSWIGERLLVDFPR